MEKKHLKFISIVGIILILILLIGTSYGYYVNRVKTISETNISGDIGNIAIKYEDGNGVIEPKGVIVPGSIVVEKTFSVKNTGNLELDNYIVFIEEVINGLERKEDLVYTITCTSSTGKLCNGVSDKIFPNQTVAVLTNSILPEEVHTYKITVQYKNSNEDQSIDMGKLFKGKINITDNLNLFENNTLAYNIVKNAQKLNTKNSTIFSANPLTTPEKETSNKDERTLSMTEDDYGISYYFRGNVIDNYIDFENMCWRIVRIQGDGSIKLILEDKTTTCDKAMGGSNASIGNGMYGYKENLIEYDYKNTKNRLNTAKEQITNFITQAMKDYLKKENWCIGNSVDFYDADGNKVNDFKDDRYSESYIRLKNNNIATLKCTGKNYEKISDYGGLLTIDEAIYSGLSMTASTANSYLWIKDIWFLLLTPRRVVYNDGNPYAASYTVAGINENGISGAGIYDTDAFIRPSIVLKSGIKLLNGDGTKSFPYIIE